MRSDETLREAPPYLNPGAVWCGVFEVSSIAQVAVRDVSALFSDRKQLPKHSDKSLRHAV